MPIHHFHDPSGGADHRKLVVVHHVITDTTAPAAPASVTGAAGMMPLADAMAAHDAALTGWFSHGSGSPKRVTIRANSPTGPAVNLRAGLVPGRTTPGAGRLDDDGRCQRWHERRRRSGGGRPGRSGPVRDEPRRPSGECPERRMMAWAHGIPGVRAAPSFAALWAVIIIGGRIISSTEASF